MSLSPKADARPEDRHLDALCEALTNLDSVEDFRIFLQDLCTPAELRSMADRWRVARLLAEGISYRTINERTGVSTATITRVARSMTYGARGYQTLLERIKEPLHAE